MTAIAHNPAIDTLRGAAILMVLMLHFALSYGLRDSPLGILPVPLLRALARDGNYGVTIFFAISGFLITTHTEHRAGSLAKVDLRQFYLLRAGRILPPLVLALTIIISLGTFGLPSFSNTDGGHQLPASHFWIGAASVLTFWHNVLMQQIGYFNYCLNIYWSLSVEEVFYLLMPIICVTLRRDRWLLAVCLAAIAAGPWYRNRHADSELFYMYGYIACFDAIAMGCISAVLAQRWRIGLRMSRALRWLAAIALAALYLRGIAGNEIFGFSGVALASAVYLFAISQGPSRPLGTVITAPLRWMGRHSYELYLFHIILLGLMRNILEKAQLTYATRLPWLLLFLLMSALLAALVAKFVSEPSNRYVRRRFGFSRASSDDVDMAMDLPELVRPDNEKPR
jgi:peptidoglycan/LPS O-acetylase OafA/YrhL